MFAQTSNLNKNANGLPLEVQSHWVSLKGHLKESFELFAMRDSYIAEAKLRRKKSNKNVKYFGQTVESLFKAYPKIYMWSKRMLSQHFLKTKAILQLPGKQ